MVVVVAAVAGVVLVVLVTTCTHARTEGRKTHTHARDVSIFLEHLWQGGVIVAECLSEGGSERPLGWGGVVWGVWWCVGWGASLTVSVRSGRFPERNELREGPHTACWQ